MTSHPTSPHSVFISYSTKDRPLVGALVQALRAAGVQVRWDGDLPAGGDVQDTLAGWIEESTVLVMVLTPHSVASDWVKDELSFARNRVPTQIPLAVGDVTLPRDLEISQGRKHIMRMQPTASGSELAAVVVRQLGELEPGTPIDPPAPATTVAMTTPEPAPLDASRTYVLMLVTIGDKSYTTASPEEVQRFARLPPLTKTFDVRYTVDLKDAKARQWREIAEKLDDLLADAQQEALRSPNPVTFVVAGRAPHCVFAYLGYRSRLALDGQILFVNKRGGVWDRIGPFSGPSDFPPNTRQALSRPAPEVIQTAPGAVGLFISSTSEHTCSARQFEPALKADSRSLSALHRIVGNFDANLAPLTEADLRPLAVLISEAKSAMPEQAQGLLVALATPAWMAFWAGRLLNAYITGFIDFTHYVPGRGYVQGLASEMNRARWVHASPRVLALSANANDDGGTRGGHARQALEDAIERELGDEVAQQIRSVTMTSVDELIRRLEVAKPDVLHVYTHGGDKTLALQDDRGKSVVIDGETFVDALRYAGLLPSLVVLVACHSKTHAEAVLELAEIVVAVDGEVMETSAIEFIKGFYRALARGNSVQTSFDQAKTHVKLQPRHDGKPFELLCRRGIDANDVVLWPKTQG
ncbi:MAG: TIR domain-containing protein [Nannocystaceae bacterium]